MSTWRQGCWRTGCWRVGSWRGMVAGVVAVAINIGKRIAGAMPSMYIMRNRFRR